MRRKNRRLAQLQDQRQLLEYEDQFQAPLHNNPAVQVLHELVIFDRNRVIIIQAVKLKKPPPLLVVIVSILLLIFFFVFLPYKAFFTGK